MKKLILPILCLLLVIGFAVWSAMTAYVNVDSVSIDTGYNNLQVLVFNMLGDWFGYGRCEITGVSLYWTGKTAMDCINPKSDEFLVSSLARKGLESLPWKRACEISNTIFISSSQRIFNADKGGQNLLCPLLFKRPRAQKSLRWSILYGTYRKSKDPRFIALKPSI